MIRRFLIAVAILTMAVPAAFADFINSNDNSVYNLFAQGATVQNFESVSGLTPLTLADYTNAYGGTAVPANAQLGGQITGLHFHSGGGSFNDPVGTPGTPAALLKLPAGDAHSSSNGVGSLEINTENLHLAQFVEVIFTNSLVDRVGIWLNPSLGPVLFTAFDSSGQSLESGTGSAGNFVAVKRNSKDIKFISIVSTSQNGFTFDDLTYGAGATTSNGNNHVVPEPGMLLPLLTGTGMLLGSLIRRHLRFHRS